MYLPHANPCPGGALRLRALTRARARRSNDKNNCGTNTQVVMHTGFTAAECSSFARKWAALPSGTKFPTPLLCNTNDCNELGKK